MSRSRPALRHSARAAHPCATQLSPVFSAAWRATPKNGWRSVSRETVLYRRFPDGSYRRSGVKIGGNLKSVNRSFLLKRGFVRTAIGRLFRSRLVSQSLPPSRGQHFSLAIGSASSGLLTRAARKSPADRPPADDCRRSLPAARRSGPPRACAGQPPVRARR